MRADQVAKHYTLPLYKSNHNNNEHEQKKKKKRIQSEKWN